MGYVNVDIDAGGREIAFTRRRNFTNETRLAAPPPDYGSRLREFARDLREIADELERMHP